MVDQKQAQDMEFSSETVLLLLFSTLLLLANVDAILLQVPLHEPHQKAFHPASSNHVVVAFPSQLEAFLQGPTNLRGGWASIWTIVFFSKVFVRTNSLLVAL